MSLETMNASLVLCQRCPRLVAWRTQVAAEKRRAFLDQTYWGKPVPGFGDAHGRVFVIGLAPGAHGSNRTGRQFTGDSSGNFLFPALYRAGFASQPQSISREDGLILNDLYTAPVCRCAPPQNKPTPAEMDACQPYLEAEIRLIQPKVFVLLGRIAFDRLLHIFPQEEHIQFAHGVVQRMTRNPSNPARWMICSYHPSRQNTQTGRLTQIMFDEVWAQAHALLKEE